MLKEKYGDTSARRNLGGSGKVVNESTNLYHENLNEGPEVMKLGMK